MNVEYSASAIAAELGKRLKQERLNQDVTQLDVAEAAGISRRAVINAENGKAQLEVFVAIMMVLGLSDRFDLFLSPPQISPLQLAKLQGKQRQRASRKTQSDSEGELNW